MRPSRPCWSRACLTDRSCGACTCRATPSPRYARAQRAEALIAGPKPGTTLVEVFRDYLRHRRSQDPGVPTSTLLTEIKATGYQGGSTPLYRYLGHGRAQDQQTPPSPRRVTSWITTDPAKLTDTQRTRLDHVLPRRPELTMAAEHVRTFAQLLTEHQGDKLPQWIEKTRRRSPRPALLRRRPADRLQRRGHRTHTALQQRSHRGHHHHNHIAQTADVWPGRLHPAPQTHTPSSTSITARHHRNLGRAHHLTPPSDTGDKALQSADCNDPR